MSFRDLLKFLPWRQRRARKGIEEDEEAEETVELRQSDEDSNVYVTGDAFRSQSPFNPYGKEARKSNGLHFLAMLMRSYEFQTEDPVCVTLLKYIYQGNVNGMSAYLNKFTKPEIEAIEIGGQKLLHILCIKGDIECLRIVLNCGVDPNVQNKDGISPLHIAVKEEWAEGVRELLDCGALANDLPEVEKGQAWPFPELPILTAARNGDFITSSLLLDQDTNLYLTDHKRNNVLHLACYSNCKDLVLLLLENNIILSLISTPNEKGNTPLHCLMTGNNLPAFETEILSCVESLLQNGASINLTNVAGKTPLYLAARSNLPSVVNKLLESGADPIIKSIDGRTALHAACHSGSHESLSLLLQGERTAPLVLEEDHYGYAPFHLAVSSCSINCCELLLHHGDHLTREDSKGRSRCSLVLRNMPSAQLLLKKLFDSSIEISEKDTDDPEFHIKMDFSVLLSKWSEDVEASLISDFSDSHIDSLYKHPLIESFLFLKWHKIRGFFYLYVFLFFLFLIVHTYYIVKTYGMNTNWEHEESALMTVHVAHIIMLIVLLITGTIIIFANVKKYFRQWETYSKVVALSTAAYVVFARNSSFQNEEIERNIAAISIFFTWVEFMMLLGRFPSLGIYILMFTRVAKSIIRFLLAFSSLLIAFTLTFGILLSRVEVFKSFPIGFVKTLMMMIGEIDYTDIYMETKKDTLPSMVITQIFLVVFLFLIPVLMANLLIGLAVNDLPDLQYHGKIRRLMKEASYLESYERLLLVFRDWTCIPHHVINLFSGRGSIKRYMTIYPNYNKQTSHRSKSHSIPSDAIKEIIDTKTKEKEKRDDDNLELSFKKFLEEYKYDRDIMLKCLTALCGGTSSDGINKLGSDVIDGSFTSRRRYKSKLKR